MTNAIYQNPLVTRYASRAMAELWSAQRKFSTWRRLWVALAEAERDLGLNITASQIAELRAKVDDIDFDAARRHEKRLRHDVMAHVHALGDAAPDARAIIHLGATSCYVTDNTDLILIREALGLVRDLVVEAIDALAEFAVRWKDLPCLGYTHFQPAQLVTVGKRATLWCYELVLDLQEIERRIAALKFLGVKGTTGTQASFLALFEGDHARVLELDRKVARGLRLRRRPIRSRGRPTRERSIRRCWPTLGGLAESGTPVRLRPPAPGTRARGRGAVRGRAGRLVGDGLQAEPDAGRADVLDWRGSSSACPPPRARRRRPSGWSGRSTTARSGGWSCPRRSWRPTPP